MPENRTVLCQDLKRKVEGCHRLLQRPDQLRRAR
jgi:hypothetical protein